MRLRYTAFVFVLSLGLAFAQPSAALDQESSVCVASLDLLSSVSRLMW